MNDFSIDKITKIFLNEDSFLFEGNKDNKYYDLIFNIDNWEINDYESFLASVNKTPDKYKAFMTPHPYEELIQPEWKTFKLKGLDAGFALHYQDKGKVDICNLHNNSDIRGISNLMLTFAKRQGGTMLDNYAGFLGDKYQENGFNKYETYEWDDAYRPQGWREDLFGTPDVEMRSHTSHDKKYKGKEGYQRHFDKKMDKAFPKNKISLKESELRELVKESIVEILREGNI